MDSSVTVLGEEDTPLGRAVRMALCSAVGPR
jgi:hypothetical protein